MRETGGYDTGSIVHDLVPQQGKKKGKYPIGRNEMTDTCDECDK